MGAESMTPRRSISPKHQRIIDLLTAEDLTVRQAAERLGMSTSSVYYACNKYKLKYRNAPSRNRIPELVDREWLYQKVAVEGLNYKEIGDLMGCSRQYVHQKVNEFGMPFRIFPFASGGSTSDASGRPVTERQRTGHRFGRRDKEKASKLSFLKALSHYARQDSNLQLLAPEASTLSIELRALSIAEFGLRIADLRRAGNPCPTGGIVAGERGSVKRNRDRVNVGRCFPVRARAEPRRIAAVPFVLRMNTVLEGNGTAAIRRGFAL